MANNIWLLFFTGDWLIDPRVRKLGYFERGVWFELICLMAQSPKVGYLCHQNGSRMRQEEAEELLGGTDEVRAAVRLLRDSGVFGVHTETGEWFCGRLARWEELRKSKKGRPRKQTYARTLTEAGLPISEKEFLAIAGMYRGVDMGEVVRACLAYHKAGKVGEVKGWLVERCEVVSKKS
jgi:hypothetical protein